MKTSTSDKISHSPLERAFALYIGVACHTLFLVAVLSMMFGVFTGLNFGRGHFHGFAASLMNLGLVLQFPLLHSWLLTDRGNKFMQRLSPPSIASDMTTTWFAFISSLQIYLLFTFWSPTHVSVIDAKGLCKLFSVVLYLSSWLFLLLAMVDADITVQSGSKGWTSVLFNRRVRFKRFPQHRTFSICRQPIYFAFALILWTAPTWTVDRIVLVCFWSTYCILGPMLKEKRYLRFIGNPYAEYRNRVPYFFPTKLFNRATK